MPSFIYEDHMMKLFAFSFKNEGMSWFKSLGKREIPSLSVFLEAFYKPTTPAEAKQRQILQH